MKATEMYQQKAKPEAISVRLDIIELCEEIAKIYKPADLKITIKMAARIAFLVCFITKLVHCILTFTTEQCRIMLKMLKEGSLINYWQTVDNELESIRTNYPDPKKASK